MENMIIRKAEQEDDIRDVAIRITDALVREGLITDCMDTDNETEFEVQDVVVRVLNSVEGEEIVTLGKTSNPYTRAERAAKAFVNHKAFDEGNVKVFIEEEQKQTVMAVNGIPCAYHLHSGERDTPIVVQCAATSESGVWEVMAYLNEIPGVEVVRKWEGGYHGSWKSMWLNSREWSGATTDLSDWDKEPKTSKL